MRAICLLRSSGCREARSLMVADMRFKGVLAHLLDTAGESQGRRVRG